LVRWPAARGAATRSRLATVRRPVHRRGAPISRAKRRRVGAVNAGAMAWGIGRASGGTIMGVVLGGDTGSRSTPYATAKAAPKICISRAQATPHPASGGNKSVSSQGDERRGCVEDAEDHARRGTPGDGDVRNARDRS